MGNMRLWHDDIRVAPPGFVWVRTNKDAQDILARIQSVTEISMDHDLGLDDMDPVTSPAYANMMGPIRCGDGCGCDLARWMVERILVPEKVTIHSWNPVAAQRMAAIFNAANYEVCLQAYNPEMREYLL